MSIDLLPYSQRLGGAVTDQEHEALWWAFADGVLPGQPSNACRVSNAGSTWEVAPGRLRIAGHLMDITATVIGDAWPSGAAATRHGVVTAFVNRLTSPWTFGVRAVLGVPGGGRPSIDQTVNGRYEVALGAFTVAPTGSVTILPNEPPRLSKSGVELPDYKEISNDTNETYSGGTTWATGTELCGTSFVAPPSGRVNVLIYGRLIGQTDTTATLSFIIRKESQSGSVVVNATSDYGVNTRGPYELGVGRTRMISGLTPGETYFVYTVHRGSQNKEIRVQHRQLTIQPLPF